MDRGWDFPGRNTGVGCHFLLQGIFPTQGLNPHLLHWQHLSLKDKTNFLKPPGGASGKPSACQCKTPKRCRYGKSPWRRKWQPTPVFLPGKSHPLSTGSQTVVTTEHTDTHLKPQAQEWSSYRHVPDLCLASGLQLSDLPWAGAAPEVTAELLILLQFPGFASQQAHRFC